MSGDGWESLLLLQPKITFGAGPPLFLSQGLVARGAALKRK